MTFQLAFLAVVAGVISIASPCVLPLLPAYVGVLSSSAHGRGDRRLVLRSAAGFVVGFTIVFVALGAVASSVGQLLRGRVELLSRVAGVAMLAMGSLIVVRATPRHASSRISTAAATLASSVPTSRTVALGAAVAFGWTPCIGPVLASVLALSSSTTTVYEGVAALVLYSAGLALPFLGIAVSLDRSARLRRAVQRRGRAVERVGGALLAVVGIGYLSGWWTALWTEIQGWVARTGWPPL